jgi:hypothetical protein
MYQKILIILEFVTDPKLGTRIPSFDFKPYKKRPFTVIPEAEGDINSIRLAFKLCSEVIYLKSLSKSVVDADA